MNLSDVGKSIIKIAPLLGAALPLPGGAALGQFIAEAFGGDITKPEDLINKIKNDPNAIVKLKQIESNENIQIAKILASRERVQIESEVRDRDGARLFSSRDVDTARNLTYILVLGSFGMIVLIPYLNPDSREASLIAALITMLVSAAKDAIRLWFGRSFKSDD